MPTNPRINLRMGGNQLSKAFPKRKAMKKDVEGEGGVF